MFCGPYGLGHNRSALPLQQESSHGHTGKGGLSSNKTLFTTREAGFAGPCPTVSRAEGPSSGSSGGVHRASEVLLPHNGGQAWGLQPC